MNRKTESAVVIGGGVVGAMCAWYLVEAGCQVTIIDRGKFGAACSHGNCGYISPSHVLPLSQPGTVKKTLLAMLKSNSPFSIKPRFSASFLSWFWNFWKQCNEPDMLAAADGRHQLLQSSQQLYRDLVNEQGINCEYQEKGLLFVFDDSREFASYQKTNDLIIKHFGQDVAAIPYDANRLLEVEPALKPGVAAGAWFYPCDAHIRPDLLLSELRTRLEAKGTQFIESLNIDQFVRESGKAKAVSGNDQQIEADQFIVATGAMTPFLNRHLGCKIPIEPGKGYSLTMPQPQAMPQIPMILKETHVAITPMKSKYRIGSTMEFVGYDERINRKRLQLLKDGAKKYLVNPFCEPIEEEWYGWRPMTYDGKPILDRSPWMNNVWVAAGHNMEGLSMATGSGKLISEMILGDDPHISPHHFSVSRF